MSANIFWSERYKDIMGKYRNQENVNPRLQNVKIDVKNDVGRRRGLSENGATRTKTDNGAIGKAPFHVYHDENEENVRSRSRVRKNVCTKELKTKMRDSEAVERIPKLKKRSVSPVLRAVSRRARSTSSSRNGTVDTRDNKFRHNHFQRSNSESRKMNSQHAQYDGAAVAIKTQPSRGKNLLSNEVKRRTSSSIQMWKDKMRKQYTGTLPKNFGGVYPDVLSANKTHTKIKDSSSAADRTKILYHRSNTISNNFTDKVWQSRSTDPDRIKIASKEQSEKWRKITSIDHRLDTIVKCSNEVAAFLNGNKDFFTAEANIARSFEYDEDNQDDQSRSLTEESTLIDTLDTLTSSRTSSILRKVHNEKRRDEHSFKKRDDKSNACQVSYECYLEDMLNVERRREERAPKLSSRFLRENINAKQRKLIVEYLIRLSMHCNYSSHVIYQTVKLFDVVIDRILLEMDNIQLIALACLWINLKREATVNELPSATTILQLAKDMYIGRERQLLTYEKKILLSVNFNICFADPFSLLFYYIWCINESENINPQRIALIYFCGSYLLDITMLDERLCDISGCVLAMAAAELSLNLVYFDNMDRMWCQSWRAKHRLTEWEERAISFAKRNIVRQVLESDRQCGFNVVYKKYLRAKNGRVSNFLLGRMRSL